MEMRDERKKIKTDTRAIFNTYNASSFRAEDIGFLGARFRKAART
jgi:hypothetical protein